MTKILPQLKGRLFQTVQSNKHAKVVISFLQGSVVMQTTFGGLTIDFIIANLCSLSAKNMKIGC